MLLTSVVCWSRNVHEVYRRIATDSGAIGALILEGFKLRISKARSLTINLVLNVVHCIRD